MRPMKSLFVAGICVVLLAAVPSAVNAQIVGYYNMGAGQGTGNQVAPITTAGGSAVNITVPNAAQLAGLDVLWVLNGSNGGYGGEYVANLADIQAAVSAGLVLIIHDRFVANAETILPGGALFNVIRATSGAAARDIDTSSTTPRS